MSATVTVTRGKTFGASEAVTIDKLNALGLPTISITGLLSNSDGVVIAEAGATPVANGTNLKAAYVAAATLQPGGSALSATNRAAVIIPPGQYDLGGQYEFDADYVDLIGLCKPRIYANVTTASTGVVYANNLGMCISDLMIENTASTGGATTPLALRVSDTAVLNLYNVHLKADGTNASPLGGKTSSGAWDGIYENLTIDGGRSFKIADFTGTLRGSTLNGADHFSAEISGTIENCTINEIEPSTDISGRLNNVVSTGNTWAATSLTLLAGARVTNCYFVFSGSSISITGAATTKLVGNYIERTDTGDAIILANNGAIITHNTIAISSGDAITAGSARSAVIVANYLSGGVNVNVTNTATTATLTANWA